MVFKPSHRDIMSAAERHVWVCIVPHWDSCKTCHIAFASHVYHLTFTLGAGGGGVNGNEPATTECVSEFVTVKLLHVFGWRPRHFNICTRHTAGYFYGKDNFQLCLWQQNLVFFEGDLGGHLQLCLWWPNPDISTSQSGRPQLCLWGQSKVIVSRPRAIYSHVRGNRTGCFSGDLWPWPSGSWCLNLRDPSAQCRDNRGTENWT